MIGAITGDIVGSIYEFDNLKSKDFTLFGEGCKFTDDTVLTIAVADWLSTDTDLVECLAYWSYEYHTCSYGEMYRQWLDSWDRKPYNSFGNGAAMRVSPCAWRGTTQEKVLELAEKSAAVTHNHPEGIKGAQATALAIWLARQDQTVDEIKEAVEKFSGYDLNQTVDDIRPDYRFDETCQGTVPQAIICALEATDFEDAIRNAISIGGDSDTVAAITGSIAEAMFGVPKDIRAEALGYLTHGQKRLLASFVFLSPRGEQNAAAKEGE